jgi:hypothetical protein
LREHDRRRRQVGLRHPGTAAAQGGMQRIADIMRVITMQSG